VRRGRRGWRRGSARLMRSGSRPRGSDGCSLGCVSSDESVMFKGQQTGGIRLRAPRGVQRVSPGA
jgi:hypothetical protein